MKNHLYTVIYFSNVIQDRGLIPSKDLGLKICIYVSNDSMLYFRGHFFKIDGVSAPADHGCWIASDSPPDL
jgi:hypothetical protein